MKDGIVRRVNLITAINVADYEEFLVPFLQQLALVCARVCAQYLLAQSQ